MKSWSDSNCIGRPTITQQVYFLVSITMTKVSYWLLLLAISSSLLFTFAFSNADASKTIDLQEIASEALAEVESMLELERRLLTKGLIVDRGTSAHMHSLMVATDSGSKQRDSTLSASKILIASSLVKAKFDWSADEARRELPLISLANTDLKSSCPDSITCLESNKYQSIDGSCHNQAHPSWGKANTPFQRILPNAYADGVFEPRRAVDGSELKSPRVITTTVIQRASRTSDDNTLVLMSWGQFITHDMTKSSSFTSADGKIPQCCNVTSGEPLEPELLHPFCLPIDIPVDDRFYSQYNQTCMTFVRTNIGADYSCSLGHAEQLNSITHWLDGSMIYGSSLSELNNLRLGQNGTLKYSTTDDGKELLPLRPGCTSSSCYFAGDTRAHENPQLTILHTLMMREHNRIARALKKLNPLWDEETLFQETRCIVVAELQHITYNEYLPAMLGEQAMADFKLTSSAVGSQYNEENAVNPSVLNEFAAAVFRVGHSQVQGNLVLYDENNQEVKDQSFTLSNSFFDSSMLPQPGFIDNAIRGLTKQLPSSVDVEYTSELTNLLFKGSNAFGMDLVSLNVQRGREHGIPDYNTVRTFCGLPKATSFEDLSNEIEQQTIDNLKKVYNSVDDIDLYIGCLSESSRPVSGSVLGPTAVCVIANQFSVIKNNDRYFYDVTNQMNSLTTGQLNEIKKSASLARIMCDNNNGDVKTMQPNAFRAPTSNNGKQLCSIIPSINLDMWKDPKAAAPSKAAVVAPSFILMIFFSVNLLLY